MRQINKLSRNVQSKVSVSLFLATIFLQMSLGSAFASSNQMRYFSQYDNRYEPFSTCGLTSAAMLLSYWNTPLTPDDLYRKYGKSKGQSPYNLADLYRRSGLKAFHTYQGTRNQIKRHLDLGRPVVVHGWFTGSGHVIVLHSYTKSGFIAYDPAGNWRRCFKCGYNSSSTGRKRLYRYAELSNSVIGVDGDIWFSVAYK